MIDVWDLISMSLDIVFMKADAILNNFKKNIINKYWKFKILENSKAKKKTRNFSTFFDIFEVRHFFKNQLFKGVFKENRFFENFPKSDKIEKFQAWKKSKIFGKHENFQIKNQKFWSGFF